MPKKQDKSTLIEMKVLPKTMTDGYEGSWWNLGVPEVSGQEGVNNAYELKQQKLRTAKQY
ncbi:3D-(3,5/4)-trihydroxycyclohexane-1,2-dione hydrolase [Bacillus sp. CECT 9360]|nr:3D-(3,5/4)-trihydroxycyclohexane-1,2-dione hydrolase [Bacillus sp. CECT 9360]